MKKLLVILFVLITIFAFASCKQDPKEAEPTPEPAPEPAPEPITQPGVLDVRPAASVETWNDSNWEQKSKFQFKLDVLFNANESIELYVKCSEVFDRIAIRQGGGDNTKFKVEGVEKLPLADFDKTEDGWYIVSIPAESVTPTSGATQTTPGVLQTSWLGLGVTFYAPEDSDVRALPCWAALRGLKLGEDYFDITEWDEEDCVQVYYSSPAAFDITLTLDEE